MEQWMYNYLKKGKKNKYGNRKVEVDGYLFDSKREAARWHELLILLKAKQISELQRQVRFPLIPSRHYGKECVHACFYIADFVYEEKGNRIAEDCKGYPTAEYTIKKKLFLEKYVNTGEFIFFENGKLKKYYKKNEKSC